MRKLLVLIVGVGIAAAACSSGGGSTSSSTSTPPKQAATAAATDPTSVPKAPSAGCGGATPAPAGETRQTLTVDGAERWWLRNVPPASDGTTPLPLVIDIHGYTEGAQIHKGTSGLEPFGDRQGFVTITPQGQGDVAHWDTTLGSTDLTFFGKVLDATEQQLCIDTNRVYTTGYSNGAFMTSAVACQFSDRIAAVAPVAGARIIAGCTPHRPVPIVAFHGTADGFVSYSGGLGKQALTLPAADGSGKTLGETLTSDQLTKSVSKSKSVPQIMAAWAKRNGCASGDTETKIAADVTKFTYDCAPADAAVLYRVTGGGHAWPGSPGSAALVGIVGPTTMNIDANEIMWKFFVAHPLRAR